MIGAGDVTEVKSGPALYKTKHSRLVAVMRRDGGKAADYARRHGVAKWYTDGMALINDPEVNAIYIATPPNSHAHYAIAAMRAGKPVYVEKPMARNYAECLDMVRTSQETGMPLRVAYYRRTLPAFLKVKELIESGVIGKPLTVHIRLLKPGNERLKRPEEMHWHVFPEISGGGHFYDLASHQFDYLDFLFGAVTEVSGMATNRAGLYPAEDTVTGVWKHASGITGSGSWCFVGNDVSSDDKIIITGEKGEIVLPCFAHGALTLKTDQGITTMEFTNPEHISQLLVQQVVDELRGIGSCVSTGDSAARTNWVLEEMVKGYYHP
jgi:predicted dehydrogenase